jgi:hypothetical protein
MTISGAVVARDIISYCGVVLAIGILEVAPASYLLTRQGLTLVAAIGLTTRRCGRATPREPATPKAR